MEMPSDANIIIPSPNNDYFVAYYSGADKASQLLYFYKASGELLKKQEIAGRPGNYSSNSEYFKVRNPSLSEIYLFTRTGEFITAYEYGTKLGTHLFDFYVSDNAELLLFSMYVNDTMYLLSINGDVLWEKPSLRVIDCRFNLDKDYLIVYSEIEKKKLIESKKSIRVLSLNDGELIDSIDDVEMLELRNNGFVIQKEEELYEYIIK